MARVKFKCRGKQDREKKVKLLELLCSNEIRIVDIFETPDGFVLLFENDKQANKVFTKNIIDILANNEFTPVLPPELRVKRSVIASRLNDLIYERNEDEIKTELIKCNSWIGEDIDSVFKFPNSSTIKITFSQTILAEKCTEKGLLAFSLSIPAYNIKQETFIPIKCCMRCYKLEDHTIRECNKAKDFKICSNCSEEGHKWFDCKAKHQCCLNCGENHSTMAMKCNKRKQIIKEKRKLEEERNKMTYVGAVGRNNTTHIQQQQPQTLPTFHSTPMITREDLLKIHTCIAHAQQADTQRPGIYELELNRALTLNNLPNIKIPPPLTETEIHTHEQTQAPKTQTRTPGVKPRKIRGIKESETEQTIATREEPITEGATAKDKEIQSMEEEILPKEASDIGLTIYTPKERGWPQERFTFEELINGINSNKYKYIYTDSRYTEEEVLNMIKHDRIMLKHCWTIAENDNFRKIRSGLLEERSPLTNRDPRTKKHNI